MSVNEILDLGDGDVLAAADDDVLCAADDADVAVAVHARQVAGIEPAVGVDRVELRLLQITDEMSYATRLQTANGFGRHRLFLVIHYAHFIAGQRPAVGLERLRPRIALARDGEA